MNTKLVDVYIGRQPIVDRQLALYAYELLFRSSPIQNEARVLDQDRATAQVIIHAFMDIGLQNLVGKHLAFLNFSESFLLSDDIKVLPRNQLVVEVLETVEPSDTVVSAIKDLKADGYLIALDDFFFKTEYASLVSLADIVKIDLMALTPQQLLPQLTMIKRINPMVKLLAEKVETQDQYLYCKSVGFDYFQGYFFARPQIVKGHRIPSSKLALLQLLASVYDSDIEFTKLSDIVSRDVSLSLKLITFVRNYPGNEQAQINSIKDAIMRFGLKKLQSWVSVLALTGVDDKPHELLTLALVRARCLESLAEKAHRLNKETYFMVGLFSCLDALMDKSMPEVLEDMSIAEEAQNALLHHAGEMGEALLCVKAIEHTKDEGVVFCDLPLDEISAAYLGAIEWASQALAALETH
jgi:EAL and modified HD-GYP domain-containing signal transduction protein